MCDRHHSLDESDCVDCLREDLYESGNTVTELSKEVVVLRGKVNNTLEFIKRGVSLGGDPAAILKVATEILENGKPSFIPKVVELDESRLTFINSEEKP